MLLNLTVELTEQKIDPEVVGLEVKTSGADKNIVSR